VDGRPEGVRLRRESDGGPVCVATGAGQVQVQAMSVAVFGQIGRDLMLRTAGLPVRRIRDGGAAVGDSRR
jgi:hypothetical protein